MTVDRIKKFMRWLRADSISVPGSTLMLILLAMHSCQYPYVADVNERTGLLVIEGGIIKGETQQTIKISRSTSFYTPTYHPVSDCAVSVFDENGNEITYLEGRDGIYYADVSDGQLVFNRNYMARIITPDGKVYESDVEKIHPVAPVDSIYFIKEEIPLDFDMTGQQNQFYIDLLGTEEESRYYRWKLTETFEYHSLVPVHAKVLSYILDSLVIDTVESLDSIYACWAAGEIDELYSSSTVNLSSNAKKRIPLHALTTETDKMNIKYSLLVEQYSLTERAYAYWNQVKIETREAGGFYTQQPGQTESNLHCVTDEGEDVLGYFWASSVSRKRIFVRSSFSARYALPYCDFIKIEDYSEVEEFPVYVWIDPETGGNFTSSNQECMNCLLRGGVNVKPPYWDDEGTIVLFNE